MNKIVLFLVFLSVSITASAQDKAKLKDSAYAVIEAIPEVQTLIKYDTSKIWHFSIRTISVPSYNIKYYWIQVGKENGQSFYPQIDFYVDPKTFTPLVFNTRTNKTMTLEELRQAEKH